MTNLKGKLGKEFMEAAIMGAGTNVDIGEVNDLCKRIIKEKRKEKVKTIGSFLGLIGLASIPILVASNLMSYHNEKSFIEGTRGNIAIEYSKGIVNESLRFPLIFGNYLAAKNYLNSEDCQKDQERYLEDKKRWKEESANFGSQYLFEKNKK